MSVATSTAIALATVAGTATGSIVAAKMQSGAATKGAELQKSSNDAALAFQKQQAETAYQSAETARHANYDQWAASQHRLSSVGEVLGFGPREIPGYVAQPDPQLAPAAASPGMSGPPTGPTGAPGAPAAVNPNAAGSFARTAPPPDVAAAYDAYVKSNNLTTGSQTDPTVNTGIVRALQAKGFNAQLAPMDSNGHSAGIVVNGQIYQTLDGSNRVTPLQPFDGGGGGTRSVGSYLGTPAVQPFAAAPVTPGLSAPGAYRSVGSYLG